MKIAQLLTTGMTFFALSAVTQAQITSARALTRRIAPQTGQTVPAPAPGRPPAAAGAPVVVDPAKVQEGKDDAERKRIEYQKKKAEEGVSYAQYDLGMRYLTGNGVEKNYEVGKKWITAASTNGYASATKKLEELKKQEKEKK
jgi:TPR repeat protein